MSLRPDNLTRAGFGAALLIIGAVSVASYAALTAFVTASGALAHSYEVIERLSDLTAQILEVESSARGFTVAGDPDYRRRYEEAVGNVKSAVAGFRRLTAGDPRQQQLLAGLEGAIEAKLAFHNEVMRLRSGRGLESTLSLYRSGQGRALMDRVRAASNRMQEDEKRVLQALAAEAHSHVRLAIGALLTGTVLSLLILGYVFHYLNREIRRRRHSEERLRQINRFYAVLTHVSQAVVRIRNRDELLERVCRIAVEDGQFRMAWVGLVDDRTHQVVPVAHSGREHGYLSRVHISVADEPEGRGPTGTCLREGRYFISNDIQADPSMLPWREEALQRGYRSSAAFPIRVDDRLIGAFMVYASEVGLYQSESITLLDEVVSELSFALKNLEVEAQRRLAVEEIQRLNADLENRVAERTTELAVANQELAARNREAELANRMKSAFLARMSHELRTPLNAIIGFSDLLAEESAAPLSEKQKRFVEHVQAGARHLLQVINDILDLSKIDAGRIEILREEFAAAEALTEVMSVIRPLAEIKRIDVAATIPPDLEVYADRTRFKQILYNLLSNAVKFTPEGGSVQVVAAREDGSVRFSVTDTGVGIPATEHQAIFDEFHQVSATTRGLREGTGLGLAITRRLVELHGGRIWVESEPGRGSRFFFTVSPGSEELAQRAGGAV